MSNVASGLLLLMLGVFLISRSVIPDANHHTLIDRIISLGSS